MIKIVSLFAGLLLTFIILFSLSTPYLKALHEKPIKENKIHRLSVFSVSQEKESQQKVESLFEEITTQIKNDVKQKQEPKNEIIQVDDDSILTEHKDNDSTSKRTNKKTNEYLNQQFSEKSILDSAKEKKYFSSNDNKFAQVSDTINEDATLGIDVKILESYPVKYPAAAVKLNIPFVVTARFLVSSKGVVDTVIIESKPERFGFGNEVVASVYKWKFQPVIINSAPVNIWISKDFHFLSQ